MSRKIGLLFLLFSLLACEEEVPWDLSAGENGKLVVEAILTNEFKTQEIQLSQSSDTPNQAQIPISGAEVRVKVNENFVRFLEDPLQAGNYRSVQHFRTQMFVDYQLEVRWQGEVYEAESNMVNARPIPPLIFAPFGNTDSLTIGQVAPVFDVDEQAMYEIDIDWSHIVGPDSSRAKLFYYTFNTVDVNELIGPPRETVVFPKGSIVIEKKYSLNDEFANYHRALLIETQWQGGVYDEVSSALPTNISNGGLGFFAVSAVRMDTLIAR